MGDNTAAIERASWDDVAMLALEFGRILMECGANARIVEEYVTRAGMALGSSRVDLRIGYASLAITVGDAEKGVTRMRKVGDLGVNQRLGQAVRELALRLESEKLSLSATRSELARLVRETPRHAGWFVDLAVGLACAAFGRLLDVDWNAFLPVFGAAAFGQFVRRQLLRRKINVFLIAAIVAFLASFLSGLTARWCGSLTVDKAMVSAVLLLVPGVPLVNAQYDVMGGFPTLGNARAVWVATLLVFLAVGVWLSQMALGEGR